MGWVVLFEIDLDGYSQDGDAAMALEIDPRCACIARVAHQCFKKSKGDFVYH
jgi:hypothetical protein